MTALDHTLYITTFFLALESLMMWSRRRHRADYRLRRAIASLCTDTRP